MEERGIKKRKEKKWKCEGEIRKKGEEKKREKG